MNKKAFTLLELVMVIVVLGILAAMALPRLDRDLTQDAQTNILSAIRYTQHLALLDDRHKFNKPKWEQRYWRIYFGTCEEKIFYAIGSDGDMEDASNARVDSDEAAIDPANGKLFWAHDGTSCISGTLKKSQLSPNIFIGKHYGITSVTAQGGCSNARHIAFDHLGRPHHGTGFSEASKPVHDGYVSTECRFVFTLENGSSFMIRVEPETGYAYIDGQPDS